MKKTHIVIVILALIWGSTWLAIKVGLGFIPPFYFAAMRFIIASAVLFPLALKGGKLNPGISPFLVLLTGLLLIPVPYGLAYWGAQFISSGLSAVLFSSLPIFVAVFSMWLLPGEKLTRSNGVGLLLGITGIGVIYFDDLAVSDFLSSVGVLTIILGTIISAVGLILVKKNASSSNPVALSAFHHLLGAVFLLPLAFVFEDWSAVEFNRASILSLFFLAIFGSGLAFALYYWLLKSMDVTKASLLVYVTPVIAAYLGWIFLDEVVTLQMVIGTGLVLGGIKLAS